MTASVVLSAGGDAGAGVAIGQAAAAEQATGALTPVERN